MKKKLTIEERILVFGLIPRESDYETLKELIKMRESLTFTEEESRKYDIATNIPTYLKCQKCSHEFNNMGGIVPSALDGKYRCPMCNNEENLILKQEHHRQNVVFNKEAADGYQKMIEMKPRAVGVIVGILEKMSEDKKLTEQYLPLYEKLVLG